VTRSAGLDSWRTVEVPAERLGGWIDRFEGRHGDAQVEAEPDGVRLLAPDGAVARIRLPGRPAAPSRNEILAAAERFQRFGIVLVRRGGFAVGSVTGAALTGSRCGTRRVQGRTKAGGWSQRRYARRRGHQADALAAAAADAVAQVLGDTPEPLVCGGDRALVHQTLQLAGAADRPVVRWLDVPDPRRSVLVDAVARARAARIELNHLA